jgi:hypothetical protein
VLPGSRSGHPFYFIPERFASGQGSSIIGAIIPGRLRAGNYMEEELACLASGCAGDAAGGLGGDQYPSQLVAGNEAMKSNLQPTLPLIEVAMGRLPADLLIRNGTWVCVQSGEFIPDTDVAVKDGRIAYIGPARGIGNVDGD